MLSDNCGGWRPNEGRLGARQAYKIAILAVILLVSQLSATTIVTLVTVHGIVLCADSLTNLEQSSNLAPVKLSPMQKEKIFIIQDRIAVAHDGAAGLYFGRFDGKKAVPLATPYFAVDIISALRRDTSVTFTTAGVAGLLREKLASQFKGFDIIPQSGELKHEKGHSMDDDPITNFTVAGYDGATAHVYQVGVLMNWNILTHHVTPVTTLYPGTRKHIDLVSSGYTDAIQELQNLNGPTALKFAATYPSEYGALMRDLDLGIDQMIILARGLLRNSD